MPAAVVVLRALLSESAVDAVVVRRWDVWPIAAAAAALDCYLRIVDARVGGGVVAEGVAAAAAGGGPSAVADDD